MLYSVSHRSTQHSTKTKQTKTVRNRSQNTNSVKTLIYNNNPKYIICLTSFINKIVTKISPLSWKCYQEILPLKEEIHNQDKFTSKRELIYRIMKQHANICYLDTRVNIITTTNQDQKVVCSNHAFVHKQNPYNLT